MNVCLNNLCTFCLDYDTTGWMTRSNCTCSTATSSTATRRSKFRFKSLMEISCYKWNLPELSQNIFILKQDILHSLGHDAVDREMLPDPAHGSGPPPRWNGLWANGHRKDRNNKGPFQGRGQAVCRIQLLGKLPLWFDVHTHRSNWKDYRTFYSKIIFDLLLIQGSCHFSIHFHLFKNTHNIF